MSDPRDPRNPHNCMIRTPFVRSISEQDLKDAGYPLPRCTDEVTVHGVRYELVSRDFEANAWTAEVLPEWEEQ